MKTINLKIYGIDCIACVNDIENILNKIDGVENAKVNYSTSLATIMLNKDIDLDSLYKELNRFGFSIPIQTYKIETTNVGSMVKFLENCFGVKEVKLNDSIIEVLMYSLSDDASLLKSYLKDFEYNLLEFDNGQEELEVNN